MNDRLRQHLARQHLLPFQLSTALALLVRHEHVSTAMWHYGAPLKSVICRLRKRMPDLVVHAQSHLGYWLDEKVRKEMELKDADLSGGADARMPGAQLSGVRAVRR